MYLEAAEPGMPVRQRNAHVDEGLLVRVGIPHSGGRLAYHAFNEGYAGMVSASAFWNPKTGRFRIPEATDLTEMDFALDSAGFTAMRLFQLKGRQRGIAGVYPWTMEQFVELAAFSGATWVSQPDLCCEPEIAPDQAAIDYRINATATLLEGMLRVVYAWQDELSKTMSAREVQNAVRIPVPVAQGWSVDDFRRSIDLMMQVWERWMPWIAPPVLIGLGSVCRRHLTDPRHGLFAILEGLEGHLPAGVGVHLFGVKGLALARVKMYPWVASVDSMAGDFAARVKARQAGISNTIAHRAAEMNRWMAAASRRAAPATGDQFRLGFNH
ncbi:deazapurine DNA modification protein DpdA family protein [Paraburkholderia atlantica]|uniref:deazapurine DNA modification protein DpdA family protein n=1 Tax=Paraburkholderia atlantica TaxID=2654982 RepID=UPI0017BFD0E0|nr:hypothetical protein [Paraburkholderia atlantica]MBB5510622.1 hypothetical protein [Paraburkholderia atlantica]